MRISSPIPQSNRRPYRGRFAPSPTGPLHFGSLVAAVGSYLQARSRGGQWLVRMEDLDPPRELPGAADAILRTLEAHGLAWDGPVIYQSGRSAAYEAAIAHLHALGFCYPCDCSRKKIAELATANGLPPHLYPACCRSRRAAPLGRGEAVRVLTAAAEIAFEDGLQGVVAQHVEREVGDFVVRRADGLYAYQLAVVVDDAKQGITEVVRGSDLLDSTPRQIHLQNLLGLPTPSYIHLPVAMNSKGQKLSKQTHAPALDDANPLPALWQSLSFLGQAPPPELMEGDLDSLWAWATGNWHLERVPRRSEIPADHTQT